MHIYKATSLCGKVASAFPPVPGPLVAARRLEFLGLGSSLVDADERFLFAEARSRPIETGFTEFTAGLRVVEHTRLRRLEGGGKQHHTTQVTLASLGTGAPNVTAARPLKPRNLHPHRPRGGLPLV